MKKLIDIIKKIKRQRNRSIVIIDKNQYFDSAKAKFIIRYARYSSYYELYLTDNGKWIEIIEMETANVLEEDSAKRILINLTAIEQYEKYFNKLEVI